MKILVADELQTNLALMTASLHKLGHEVVTAMDGAAAIELFKQHRPDLIILDETLQEMNGSDCTKILRVLSTQGENWIPIIFLTTKVDDNNIIKCLEAGADDYLMKPCSEMSLVAKLKVMQRISEMNNQLITTKKELKTLASIDSLTHLYNRLEFEKKIQEKLIDVDKFHLNLVIFFLDLGHLKIINDSLGYHIGDLLLKEVARRLKSTLKADDFIARLGSDEFVIIFNHLVETTAVHETAKNIIQNLTPVYHLHGHHIRISISIGIACYPYKGTTHVSFLQNADIAMYHAKKFGQNNYQLYTENLHKKYKQQITLEHELKFALERKELYLVYQPICNLLSKKPIGMEVLLRWLHPQFGRISPNVFIPMAEESGLIIQIGNWVLNQACKQGAAWYVEGLTQFKLAINISLHQLVQDNFLEIIHDIFKATKFPPHLLELELTETAVIAYTQHLKNVLNTLHEMGVSISIDDFGNRYSFLTSLRYLPINTFKIDKIFLKNVTTEPKNSIIVKSLIALGNSLKLNVIAEGVKTEEQRQFLVINGCFSGQGFLFSKPMRVKRMSNLLKANFETSLV